MESAILLFNKGLYNSKVGTRTLEGKNEMHNTER